MNIYESLGIERILNKWDLPTEKLIDKCNNTRNCDSAEVYFRTVDKVTFLASLERGKNHFMQVIEVELNAPDFIEKLSVLIQEAIKSPVFFIFKYEGRYLLVQRSFMLTMSTENVRTPSAAFCSDWIYEEYLQDDLLLNYTAATVKEYGDCDEAALASYTKKNDNGDRILFKDLLGNAERLNKCIAESDGVSARWFIDWLKVHAAGYRIELSDFIDKVVECETHQFVGDYLFIEKSFARNTVSDLDNSFYTVNMDHTGRHPMEYFNDVEPASSEEAEELSCAFQYGTSDMLYLILRSNRHSAQRSLLRQAAAEAEKRHAEDLRRIEEEQRAAEQLRLEEEQRAAEQLRLEEEQRIEESRRSEYREKKLCQYCGSRFKGVFRKVCSGCGKPKDYAFFNFFSSEKAA